MIGLRVNNYDIVSVLGEGGMGTVYLAVHSVMGRKAAIKLLRRELAEDKTLVARFVNEARAANAIRHPNIIDVIDVGTLLDSGLPYMMMEFLEGENLAQRLEKVGRLSVSEAIQVAVQTASALAAAHGQGIVHRDLKPDNLFLVPDLVTPGTERVKVLDFGIAKLRGDTSSGAVKTNAGSIMGTPPYMSPEQCRGIAEEVDHRADIYALGIILYEMLCGTPPFVSPGFGELLIMHLTRTPAPPRQHNAAIPAGLERTILQALAKKPEERFPSMGAFRAELSRGNPDVSENVPASRAFPAGSPSRGSSTGPHTMTTLSSTSGQIVTVAPDAPARPRRKGLIAVMVLAAGAAIVAGVAVVGTRGAPVAGPTRARAPIAKSVTAPAAVAPPPAPPPSPPPRSPQPAIEPPPRLAPGPPPRDVSPVAASLPPPPRREAIETQRRSMSTSKVASKRDGKNAPPRAAAPRAVNPADSVSPRSPVGAVASPPVPPANDTPPPLKTKRAAEKW